MDARAFGHLDGLPAAVDVLLGAAGEPGDLHIGAGLGGYGAHGLEIAGAGGRKARLDDIHAQHLELVGEAQLLLKIHGGARRLLAVAQGGVEEIDAISHCMPPKTSG